LSNLLELLGFAALVGGTYELAGRGLALIVLAACLILTGMALDGIHPVRTLRGALRVRYRRIRAQRKVVGEPNERPVDRPAIA
jgi:hypothetical protein